MDELKGLVATHHRVLGRAPRMEDQVFLTARGKPWAADTGNVRRLFKPILKAAGIERNNARGEHVDVHSLRHTAATRLARAGWPMAIRPYLLRNSGQDLNGWRQLLDLRERSSGEAGISLDVWADPLVFLEGESVWVSVRTDAVARRQSLSFTGRLVDAR